MAKAIVLQVATEKTPEQLQGQLIRCARLSQRLTQRQLGALIGICHSRISQIESGAGTDGVMIFRIARALGQSIESFEV